MSCIFTNRDFDGSSLSCHATWSIIFRSCIFGQPFVKRFALCYQTVVCLSVLSVCDAGVLWPNGWMDQDETWLSGRPRQWPHCVRWEPRSPPKLGGGAQHPQFWPTCCGQTTAWVKVPLGTGVSLGPGDIVLHAPQIQYVC